MKNRITVKLHGPGYRVTAYVINNKILKILKNASVSDALYEENPISLVGNIAKAAYRVTNGFDIRNPSNIECALLINDNEIKIENLGYVDTGSSFEDCLTSERNKTLVAFGDETEPLGKQIKIKKDEMLVIETIDVKAMEIEASFDTDLDVSLEDLRLGATYLDTDTDLSLATYHCGLLNGMESDISILMLKDKTFDFEIVDILNSYPSQFFLVSRDSPENWKAEFLG